MISGDRSRDSRPSPDRSGRTRQRSEEHTSELQSHLNLVCRLLLEKKTTYTSATRRAYTSAAPLLYDASTQTPSSTIAGAIILDGAAQRSSAQPLRSRSAVRTQCPH